MSDLLVDPLDRSRYNKAKAYVQTLYRLHPTNAKLVPKHRFADLAYKESHDFWMHVARATPGYQHKNPPSQETVDVICDLINLFELVEECR